MQDQVAFWKLEELRHFNRMKNVPAIHLAPRLICKTRYTLVEFSQHLVQDVVNTEFNRTHILLHILCLCVAVTI